MHGLEFNGQFSFLKAGLYYADHITAVVQPTLAGCRQPQFAYGMEGICNSVTVKGVFRRTEQRERENLECQRDGLTVGLALHPRYVGR
ncbi:glycogen/starch synthase [Shigella flexneri]